MFVDGVDEALKFGAIGNFRNRPAALLLLKIDRLHPGTLTLKLGLSSSCKKEIEAVGFGGSGRNVDCGK